MKTWLFLSFILHNVHTISIGHISNVSLTLVASSYLSIMNGTSRQCLCEMATSSNISAFNYFLNTTCQFFSNTSLANAYFSWTVNANSTFYFLHLPSKAEVTEQYTTVTPALTTVATCSAGKQNFIKGNRD